jgi:hypothetical protein
MRKLINSWSRYLSKEEVEEHLIAFCQASQEDKECMIAETFGIFDGKLNGDVFTYYYFCGDTVRYWGTDNWWKGTDFRRVDYNFMTDKAVVTPIKKRTKQIVEMASENNYRTL